MKKFFLVCVCLFAISCSPPKAAFEYDDVKNNLHLSVPNHDWIIQYDPSCDREICWNMLNPKNVARIYLVQISRLDSRDLVGEMNKTRDKLLADRAKDMAHVSNVSSLTVAFGASFAYFSWDSVGTKETRRFHAAYLQSISDTMTTKVYLFVAGSLVEYGKETETDFYDFLKSVRPITDSSVNQ